MNMLVKAACAFGLLLCVATADATIIQLSSPNDLQPTDTTLAFPDADGSTYTNSVSYALGANTATFTTNDSLTRYLVGTDYFLTAFANGTSILTSGLIFSQNPSATLSFATGVSELGFNFEDANFGDYSVTFTAYDGANALGTFSASGSDPTSLAFIGAAATNGDVITSLQISDNVGNAFAFGPISIAAASGNSHQTVPEPSALALFCVGLAAFLGKWIRKRYPVSRPA